MKLDDFFNPVEMTNGLTSIARVEKLVSLMQQEQWYINKITSEATQCWSTIISILTATQNIDHLRQFIKLGGLHYLGEWLQEAQRCNVNADDKHVEEVINMVLTVLVKLPIDQEGLTSCGIGNIVKHLHSHRNAVIQEKAKKLSDAWQIFTEMKSELDEVSNGNCSESEHCRFAADTIPAGIGEHPHGESTSTPCKAVPLGGCTKSDASDCRPQRSSSVSSSGTLHFESTSSGKDALGTTSSTYYVFESAGVKQDTGDGSIMDVEVPKPSSKGIGSATDIHLRSETGVDTGISSKPVESEELDGLERKITQENAVKEGSRSVIMMDFTDKQTVLPGCDSETAIPAVSYLKVSSQKTSFEAESCSNIEKGKEETDSASVSNTCNMQDCPTKNVALKMEAVGSSDYWKKMMKQRPLKQTMSYDTSKFFQNAPVTLHGNRDNLGEICQDMKTSIADDVGKELNIKTRLGIYAEENSSIDNKVDASMQRLSQMKVEPLTGKGVEMELTYDPDDALEVARLVAKEVEQEVGIYREASGGSSFIDDRIRETVLSSTAESSETKKNDCLTKIGGRSKLGTEHDIPDSCSTKEEMDEEMASANEKFCLEVKDPSQEFCPLVSETDGVLHEQESSQLTTIADDQAVNHLTYICSFDLNEDAQNEELECPDQSVTAIVSSCHVINLSTPIPILATSRGPACLPTIPLHFEGELGWRGFAATSAFRPVSFCKAPDKEKACSIEENNNTFKQSHGFRGIDLNVAEAADDSLTELFPRKHVPVSSMHHSSDSYVGVCSRSAGRLNLDLNCLGDNDDHRPDLLSDWRTEDRSHHQRNGACSPSPTSSSKHYVRDFDLNANPSFGEAHDISGQPQCTVPSKNGIVDDPSDSIFKSAMHLVPNDKLSACRADLGSVQDYGHGNGMNGFQHPAHPFLMVRPNALPSMEQMERVVTVQPALAYSPQPAFSYNRFGMGPAVPLPSVYAQGVVPYMVDLRGATIIPQQMLGSSALSSFHGTPYLMDVTGAPGTNYISNARPSIDLNARVTSLEPEARGGDVRHLSFPANNSSMEEPMKSFQQMDMSGPSMKRKEPECGWESYQGGYKKMASWQ